MSATTRERINLLDLYPTPKYAAITAAANGDNTVVALAASKKIRVLAYKVVAQGGAVDTKWKNDTAGTDVTGLIKLAAAGSQDVGAYNPAGHFESATAKPLVLNLSGAVQTGGYVVYIEV